MCVSVCVTHMICWCAVLYNLCIRAYINRIECCLDVWAANPDLGHFIIDSVIVKSDILVVLSCFEAPHICKMRNFVH